MTCASKTVSMSEVANISLAVSSSASSIACDGTAAFPAAVELSSVVRALPVFRSPGGMIIIECVLRAIGGSAMGSASVNFSIAPTLWPSFDDALLIENK